MTINTNTKNGLNKEAKKMCKKNSSNKMTTKTVSFTTWNLLR